ncbi:MAG: DoxX family membrane protein [Prevotellaceae bacterium]|jgi:uncharacterized membrane protein YphA (DoxX/SURF4 family)|nr:DoxX family membrane protein [Prevotellaceae bacterium]
MKGWQLLRTISRLLVTLFCSSAATGWQLLRTISRLLVGVLFIFSGYTKVVDPQGFAIKLNEYFVSLHIQFLEPLALTFAILVIAAELTMGLCLIARLRMTATAWAVLLFMSFFTLLTLFIAVNGDIVSDCGCFGDAIKLSNWATFLKNVAFMPFVLIIFFQRKKFQLVATSFVEWGLLLAFFMCASGLGLYSNRHLPLIDFMAYKVGVNIREDKSIPQGAESDEYRTILIYEKDGVQQEFDDTNFPWQDTTWIYVETKEPVLIKKGYTPTIHDFSITSYEEGDITDIVLSNPSYTLILTSPKLAKANARNISRINDLFAYCNRQENISFLAMTASSTEDITGFINATNAGYPIHTADETTLKSMVRSNPGLMLIKDATILAKWSEADIPTIEEVTKLLSTSPDTIIRCYNNREFWSNFIIIAILAISALFINFIKTTRKD